VSAATRVPLTTVAWSEQSQTTSSATSSASISLPMGFARSMCSQISGGVTACARSVIPVRTLPGAIAFEQRLAALLGDQLGGLRAAGLVDVGDRHPRAAGGEPARGRAAHPVAAAGHQGYLAGHVDGDPGHGTPAPSYSSIN
jgi:hypothetical protein